MREANNREFSVGEWFELKQLSTICGVVHLVKNTYTAKRFCNASSWLNHCFNFNRFYIDEKVPVHRLVKETVK